MAGNSQPEQFQSEITSQHPRIFGKRWMSFAETSPMVLSQIENYPFDSIQNNCGKITA